MKIKKMTYEKLIIKMNQAWEMAGLARQDGDIKDCERRTKEAKEYQHEINMR